MANNDDTVTARVTIKEKRDFFAACEVEDKKASEVLRVLMEGYVKRVIRKGNSK